MQRGQPKYNYERAFGLAWLGRMGGWTHCKLATPKPNEARMGAKCANGSEALRPAAANHDAPTEQKLSRFTPLQVARTTSRTYNAPTGCKRDARHAQPGCNITCPKLVLQLAALSAWTQSSRGPLRFCSQTNFGLNATRASGRFVRSARLTGRHLRCDCVVPAVLNDEIISARSPRMRSST